jgi:Ring finger domain
MWERVESRFIVLAVVVFPMVINCVLCVCHVFKKIASRIESHVTSTPSPELQRVRVIMSRRRAQQPSQVQPSAPPQETRKEERARIVNECLFCKKLEEGDSVVAPIESILAAAQDHYTESTEEHISSRSTRSHSEPVCSICLDGYKTGETICRSKMNECHHIFHQECIVEWMIDNDVCPLCRTNLMEFYHTA